MRRTIKRHRRPSEAATPPWGQAIFLMMRWLVSDVF
jgi:hypothetical protein